MFDGSVCLPVPSSLHPRRPLMRLVAVLIVCTLSSCATQVDRVVVRDAQLASIANGSAASSVNRSLEIHRIVEGKGVAFSRRSYDRGSRLAVDDEQFEFISWTLPVLDDSSSFEVREDRLLVVYSRGPSAFPDQACIGVADSGRLDVEARPNGSVHVHLSLRIVMEESDGPEAQCPNLEVVQDDIYELLERVELTPWLGGAFAHPYDASYR
jgi:hypothetical protein